MQCILGRHTAKGVISVATVAKTQSWCCQLTCTCSGSLPHLGLLSACDWAQAHACILASFTNCKQTDYIVWLQLGAGRDAVVLDPAEHWASGENHQGDNRLAHAALASTHLLGNTHTRSLQLRFNLATPCSSLMRSYSAEGEQL